MQSFNFQLKSEITNLRAPLLPLTIYFLLLTSYSLLITLYQLPCTTYQLPTFPIDKRPRNKRLQKIIRKNGAKEKMVGSIFMLSVSFFNHVENQLWGCLNIGSPTDPSNQIAFPRFHRMKIRSVEICGPD